MKIQCPRCEGSGLYESFGVCFRCNGRKVVSPTPPRVAKVVTPPTRDESVARCGEELVAAAESYWD